MPSVVEVPIRLSLQSLFDEAEQEMPLQAGNRYKWQKVYGIWARYEAWRGPLSISMQGNELLVQAHVRYWLQARKKLVGGLKLKSSCGVQQPPRQAVIGVLVRLSWSADWTLWPQFRVLPTRFLDECKMTFAGIDVTPLISQEFQKQLEARMRNALMSMAPRLAGVRARAERNWLALQQPVPLWQGQWLLLNPQGVALSPLNGQGNWVETRLALALAPYIVSGPEPSPQLWQLPPLMQFYPQAAGVSLQLAVDLSYADLGRAVTEEFAGSAFDIKGRRASVEAVELSGQGQQVSARLRLAGDLAGEVVITADVGFDPQTQQFAFDNLQYTASLEDAWLEADARLLYRQLRKGLEASANRHLQQQMGQWKERLATVFERIAPEDMQLDVTPLQLRDVQLQMAENTLQLNGMLSGYVLLVP